MPVKLADYLAKPFSPSVEGVPLQCELRQLARLQHGGRRLDVAARDALAFSVDVIVASMFALRGIARGVLFFARLAGIVQTPSTMFATSISAASVASTR
jgi:hypothetical protein